MIATVNQMSVVVDLQEKEEEVPLVELCMTNWQIPGGNWQNKWEKKKGMDHIWIVEAPT